MKLSISQTFAIRYIGENGERWFSGKLFSDMDKAVEHAILMSGKPGFCSSFSVKSVERWLEKL